MIPVGELFITEGIWSFMKNSFASVLGKRKQTNVKQTELDAERNRQTSEAAQRRLTPRPLASSREKLGFKTKLTKQK